MQQLGGSLEKDASKGSTTFTVADAVTAYLRWYAIHREAIEDTTRAIDAHILPSLGHRPLAELSTPEIRSWHETLATTPPRARRGKRLVSFSIRKIGNRLPMRVVPAARRPIGS